MKIVYIPDDETTSFDTAEECQQYEAEQWRLKASILQYFTLYDGQGKVLNNYLNSSGDEFWDKFEEAYRESKYIYVSETDREIQDTLFEETGYDIPYKKGMYRWAEDGFHDGWHSLHDDIEEMSANWRGVYPDSPFGLVRAQEG